jgi:hypothetical protein
LSEEETLSSMDASREVHSLVAALHPWPTSNERAYWIVNEHLKDLRLSKQAHKISSAVHHHLSESALEALHLVIDALGEDWSKKFNEAVVLAVQYAFRKEEEVCGDVSSAPYRRMPSREDSSG